MIECCARFDAREIPACFTNAHIKGVESSDSAFLSVRSISVFRRPGGTSGEPEPDPISNSAVKLPSADDTKSQGLEK